MLLVLGDVTRGNASCSRDLLKKKLAHVDQRDADQRGGPVLRNPPVKKKRLQFPTFFLTVGFLSTGPLRWSASR
eukprot:COSAG02_NODE_1381_length_12972_cov_75.630700_7_plen_74_part_00